MGVKNTRGALRELKNVSGPKNIGVKNIHNILRNRNLALIISDVTISIF